MIGADKDNSALLNIIFGLQSLETPIESLLAFENVIFILSFRHQF